MRILPAMLMFRFIAQDLGDAADQILLTGFHDGSDKILHMACQDLLEHGHPQIVYATSLEKLPGRDSLLGFTVRPGMHIGKLPEATGWNVWHTKPCLMVEVFHSDCWVSCDVLLAFIEFAFGPSILLHVACHNTNIAPGCSLPSCCVANAASQAHASLL